MNVPGNFNLWDGNQAITSRDLACKGRYNVAVCANEWYLKSIYILE